MIKNLLTRTAILLLACQASAQITLTSQTSTPQVGDIYTFKSLTKPNIDQLTSLSGANQTWDYSTVTGTSSSNQTNEYKDPSSFNHISIFPTANIGFEAPTAAGNSAQTYMKSSTSSIELLGLTTTSGTTTQIVKNDEGYYLLKFPMTFNTEYTDSLKGSSYPLVPPGSNLTRLGVSTMTGDGYGDLILPYGTVHDVLRVKIERTYSDYLGSIPALNYTESSYFYYTDYSDSFIAQYTILSFNGNEVINSFNYRLESSFPNMNTNDLIHSSVYQVSPNPANSTISISNIEDNTQIEILNIQGKRVKQLEINSSNSIDISELNSGLYFINLKNKNDIKTLKFIKQ